MKAAAPLTERNPYVLQLLQAKFGEQILEHYESNGMLVLLLDAAVNVEICEYLKSNPELDYNMMLDMCGVDYPARAERFELVLHLHSMKFQHRIRLRFPIAGKEPAIRTLNGVWAAANWAEREAFDFFGITFTGHPDLKRIFNPFDFEGNPLRKDFPTRGLKRGRFPLGHVINNKRQEFPKFHEESSDL